MEVACPLYLPAGVIRGPDGVECVVVVKLTFSLDGSGWGRMARVQEPLSGDRYSPEGRLHYPSDFGLRKRICDVVVVGQMLSDTATPMRLRMGRLVKDVASPSQLGARGQRRDGAFAPVDQRVPCPSPPFEFSLEHHAGAFAATIPGPLPSAALIYESEWRAQYPMELDVDAILLDPLRALCVLTLRGSFRAGGQLTGALLVLDPAGRGRVPTSDAASWPHYACETPPLEEPATEDLPTRNETVRLAPQSGARVGASTVPMSRAEALGLAGAGVGRSTVPMSRAEALGVAETGRAALRRTQPLGHPAALGPAADDEETTQVGAVAQAPPIVFGAPPTRTRSSTVPPPMAADPDASLPFSRPMTSTAFARPQEPAHDALPFVQPGEQRRPPPPSQPIVFGDRPVPQEQTAGPSELPPPAPSSSGLPFVTSAAPAEPAVRRPMMTVGSTPLGRAPIPFARAGAKSVPPPRPPPSAPEPPDPYAEPTQDTPLASGNATQIGMPAVVSSAPLPFGAGPSPAHVTPPPPVAMAPPPPVAMAPPPPVAMAPPPPVAMAPPAVARSFGLGGGPSASSPALSATPFRPAPAPAASHAPDVLDELIDARVVAAVLVTPVLDRRAASAVKSLDDLDWSLGLAKWMDTLDEEAAADPPRHDALQRLMSALNEEALQARGYGART